VRSRWTLGRVQVVCDSCASWGGTGCFLSLGYHGYPSLLLLRDTPPSHTPVHHYCRIMAAEECYRTRWAYQTTPVRSRPLPSPSQPSCHRCGVGEPPQASSHAQRPFFIVLQLSCACRIVGNHQQFDLVPYSDDPIEGACVAVQDPSVVKIDARPLGENLQLQLPKETKCGIDG
jgi:hypothetical protein